MPAAITCRQNDNVPIPWFARVAIPAVAIVWNLPIPLWLGFEVAGLRFVVVRYGGYYGFSRRVISVVLDWYVAKESEENYEDRDYAYRKDCGSVNGRLIYVLWHKKGSELSMGALATSAIGVNGHRA
jgi:hypothetical protein